MRPLQTNLSIYSKFNFERPPVGVKFLFFRPEGMKPLTIDKNLLRAMTYSTGELYNSKTTPVMGCAWIYPPTQKATGL